MTTTIQDPDLSIGHDEYPAETKVEHVNMKENVSATQSLFSVLTKTSDINKDKDQQDELKDTKQAAFGEDLVCLPEHKEAQNPRFVMSMWLIDLMTSLMPGFRLKAILPFLVSYDIVMSSVPPVTDMVQTIAERLRQKNDNNTASPPRTPGTVSQTSLADMEPGIKLPTSVLIQAQASLLALYGVMDDCYVHLMKSGGFENHGEVLLNVRKKKGLKYHIEGTMDKDNTVNDFPSDDTPRGRYRLLEAEKNCRNPHSDKQNQIDDTETNKQSYGDTQKHFMTMLFGQNRKMDKDKSQKVNGETTHEENDEPVPTDANNENNATKNKKGLKHKIKRMITAPFRWIKQKV